MLMYGFCRCSCCSLVGLVFWPGESVEFCLLFDRGSGEDDRAESVTVPSVLLILMMGGAVLMVSPGARNSELED